MAICIDNQQEKQRNGVWVDYLGSRFHIVYASNLSFQRKLGQLQRPHKRALDRGSLDPAISQEILAKAITGTLLIGWEKVVDGSNNPVQFDEAVAIKALMNNDDLLQFIQDYATDLANFRDDQNEAEEKP